jgi:hypothetical protein
MGHSPGFQRYSPGSSPLGVEQMPDLQYFERLCETGVLICHCSMEIPPEHPKGYPNAMAPQLGLTTSALAKIFVSVMLLTERNYSGFEYSRAVGVRCAKFEREPH